MPNCFKFLNRSIESIDRIFSNFWSSMVSQWKQVGGKSGLMKVELVDPKPSGTGWQISSCSNNRYCDIYWTFLLMNDRCSVCSCFHWLFWTNYALLLKLPFRRKLILVWSIISLTVGWLTRYRHSSPMYCTIVTLYFTQSFQNWLAENFLFNTHVAPVIQRRTYKLK